MTHWRSGRRLARYSPARCSPASMRVQKRDAGSSCGRDSPVRAAPPGETSALASPAHLKETSSADRRGGHPAAHTCQVYPLADANLALSDVWAGRFPGAAVVVP